MKFRIDCTSDAKTFVENSGVTNWKFTGRASAEGFAVWIRANRSEIDTENYAPELYEYLSSVGENPADYGVVYYQYNIRAIITKAETDGLTIDDGNVVDLIADNLPLTLKRIRELLVIQGFAERFPNATRSAR